MRLLITNDDGINAPGLNILANRLMKLNHQVIIVAPEVEKSASSHSITLSNPLRIFQIDESRYATTGTPADSVILALQVIIKTKIDIVISGINRGPNLGEDIFYSGTVAAAIEAMHHGLPAIAVSLCSKSVNLYDTAAHYVGEMLEKGITELMTKGEILNINVPAVTLDKIKGIKATKTGKKSFKSFVSEHTDPRGNKIYWLGGDAPDWVENEETDFYAVNNNYISVTPLAADIINYKSLPVYSNWFSKNQTTFNCRGNDEI